MIKISNDWQFVFTWTDGFGRGEGDGQPVRLPHTVREMPLHCSDSTAYETVCGYRKWLSIPAGTGGKRLFLQFDGAAHIAQVYVNGTAVASHRCGYTAFRAEITDAVRRDGRDLVAVKLDCTENPAIPPFGFLVDYLTYGGLYRDVWLDVRPAAMIRDLFVHTPDLTTACISCQADPGPVRYEILDGGTVLASGESEDGTCRLSVPEAKCWNTRTPNLYRCRATLLSSGDSMETTFGFRTLRFAADGFYLNGEKTFLRGLNRHQCYPYIGYAAPERLQREDARILKEELACNYVRTSHYPQSQYFVDECDRLGLLVFTEIPGWQHIGDMAWQDQAVENVREMVTQYRNHPSIILWGVRINESQDNDQLYIRTNAAAHQLDPSRPTSGVRYLQKSSLLEDVYAYNDFSHVGTNPGVKPKEEVVTDMTKPLLISECNGHMFPTKAFDPWQKRQDHALRHARVIDDAMADGAHLGVTAWCMFDYATHKDFGSGDRICYHGVMDPFRNPKLAAAVYASQGEDEPVLEVGSPMDIGDYSTGKIDRVFAFTNAEELKLYKNGTFVTSFRPGGWKSLPHGPIWIDDTIGEQLVTREGFDEEKAAALRRCLIAAGRFGFEELPAAQQQEQDACLARYGMSFDDLYALYGKYVGNWGDSAPTWRFDAIRDGQVAASVTKGPSTRLHLQVRVSHTALVEDGGYDMAAVRVRVLDEFGNLEPYAQLPVCLELRGPAELAGPAVITLEGGSGGTYVRSAGMPGQAVLTLSTPQTEPVELHFTITMR